MNRFWWGPPFTSCGDSHQALTFSSPSRISCFRLFKKSELLVHTFDHSPPVFFGSPPESCSHSARASIGSAHALPIWRRSAEVGPERAQNQWKSDDSCFRCFRVFEVNVSVACAPMQIQVGENAPWARYGPDFVRGVAIKRKDASRVWFSH